MRLRVTSASLARRASRHLHALATRALRLFHCPQQRASLALGTDSDFNGAPFGIIVFRLLGVQG
jgi:hypothetical protein